MDTIGAKNKFFAKIDLRWGYNQIPIQQSDIPKTAITSPCGHDEWLVMNFGFTDAPAYFQSTIERIVGDVLYKGVVVYLDDILIYAETFEEFSRLLETVLARLNAAGAKIHVGKSDFLPTTLTYLGMVFSANGVQHLPDRVQQLNTYSPPESLKALRSFIGFANYFRTFIPKFAQHEAQLRQLPDRNFLYTDADNLAFEALRSAVSSTSVLAMFDGSLPIQLHVDASGEGLGAVLCQVHPQNVLRVVAYASRLLSPAERRYTNTERELLAIEWGVCDRFRLQLTGLPFEVHTDHAALVHECRLKQPTSRIHRMLLKLDAFDCKIVYKPGHLNTAADFLSRLPDSSVSLETPVICNINKDRQPVPAPERRKLIQEYHVDALQHLGFTKTYDAMCQRFFWPGMARDIKVFINECDTCLRFNTASKPLTPVEPVQSTHAHDIMNIDIVGPLPKSSGKRFIIVAVDHFSKFGFAVPVERVNSFTTQRFLHQILQRYGTWGSVITDNAKVFTGKRFTSLLKKWKIKACPITPRHPEANGGVERFVRTLRQLLRKNSTESTWATSLPTVLKAYNCAKHTATSVSPIEVFLQQPATLSVDSSHQVLLSEVRPPSGISSYRASYAKAATTWLPGTRVWHIPRKIQQLKTGVGHFQATRVGPYKVVGPSSLPQHILVTDDHTHWSLPLWELSL
jgi:hypothetical protein